MLLFDSLHGASTAMSAGQLGMQVVGQNLANVQTAGYARERLDLAAGTSRKLGSGAVVGTGVQVSGVVQVIDKFLEERLRTSTSDASSTAAQSQYYTQLEALLNETTDNDLSSTLSEFFNAIDNIQNEPENVEYRSMVVQQGQKLTQDINGLSAAIVEMQRDVNTAITDAAARINELLQTINGLNKNITQIETVNGREALGLRDQRLAALTELSQLVNIKTTESKETKAVSIYCGSNILLADGKVHEVSVDVKTYKDGTKLPLAQLYVKDNHSDQPATRLDVKSGTVYGLYQAHETVLGGYYNKLNDFTRNLITEFNEIYTSGQGLTGYGELTALTQVDDVDGALIEVLTEPAVSNGAFFIQLFRKETDGRFTLVKDKQINIDENTTLQDIADSINGVDGIKAAINNFGELKIESENPYEVFSFAEDSSGVLSALGLNTFFTGTSAGNIGINQTVIDNPATFAASIGGAGQDVENGVTLSAMSVAAKNALGGASIRDYYGGLVSETILAAGTMKAVAESDTLYQQALQTQRDAVSGVNVDEETILMMTYQRMYQANSRLVSMINEMLETLIAM
ncbi:MAG: flagellar hook-associated protein FlgK [Planctomycetaceae bacterium]|jgi:flagellar hook-associated protein 1 FlgK|nr:flagellar hook-associated protein FlgK [Planctomycetaceae bacterium]